MTSCPYISPVCPSSGVSAGTSLSETVIVSPDVAAPSAAAVIPIMPILNTRFQGDAKITSEVEPDGEIYEKNGITYYLFPNLERNKCHWVQDGFLCEINGNLTFDEIKQMIDSIK